MIQPQQMVLSRFRATAEGCQISANVCRERLNQTCEAQQNQLHNPALNLLNLLKWKRETFLPVLVAAMGAGVPLTVCLPLMQ